MVIVEGEGGVGEEVREKEKRDCGRKGSRGSLTVAAFPLLHGNGEAPRVRLPRTQPEAHSQADGPYTSA